MTSLTLMAMGGVAALTACAISTPEVPSFSCTGNVTAYGSRAALRETPDMVAVNLEAITTTDTMIGYGPSAGYMAELTLVDGVWQIAQPTGADTVRVATVPAAKEGAVFLVTAAPDAWASVSLGSPVLGLNDLEAQLAEIAARSACPAAPIPFRLTGTIADADWSAVGRPMGAKGRLGLADVTLVGIFDRVDPDRYFMPEGRRLHVHVLSADGNLSGHLDDFASLEAGMLSLPQ